MVIGRFAWRAGVSSAVFAGVLFGQARPVQPANPGPLGMPMPPPPTFSPFASYEPETEPPPPLMVALSEQLGLKLKPKKAPLDVLVIDEAQRMPILQ